MIKSDILIIGAGPVGLFAVFEAGLMKMKCHLIDVLPKPGGQCSEIYPKKPIYDIPAYPEILADGLIDKLMEQCSQFQPGFTLGERAMTIDKQENNSFVVTTDKGTKLVYADGTNVVDTGFSSAGIDAVVDDTSPQLGGNLDANGNNILIDSGNFIGDENGLEQVKFTTTASAVNELTVVNAATTNAPQIQATGGDSNVDMNLVPKGLGRISLGAAKIIQTAEKVTTSATASTGTINYDVITQAVLNFTTDASGNFTINLRGDGSNALNAIMDIGESLTVAFISKQGSTAYYNNVVKIDGSTVTPEWQGGSAPSSGNINSVDAYTYTIIKTADATFTSLAVQTQFA